MAFGIEQDKGVPRRTGWLFVLTILFGSFLLFLVQPMIARMALPRLGGAPAVWNSAMLVYQALLLGGYAYAHLLRPLSVQRQATVQLGLLVLACLWLPIGLSSMQLPHDAEPALWVPWLLIASIGPLFFVVSAQAPLVQRWFNSATGGAEPYALYAASNLGSFGGLFAYPLLVEPFFPLSSQRWLWSGAYLVLILMVLACWFRIPHGEVQAEEKAVVEAAAEPELSPKARVFRVVAWIALSFVPSGLMLATTTYLTTDIVAVPMLWVLPLGLYLLSFTVAFSSRQGLARWITRYAPVVILLFGGVIAASTGEDHLLNIGMALGLLFVAATALHSRLHSIRPAPERLTGFYLALALGGALGGVFAGLLAPVIFDWTYEYPILILAAGLFAPQGFLLPWTARFWRGAAGWIGWRMVAIVLIVVAIVWLGLNVQNPIGGFWAAAAFCLLGLIGLLSIGRKPAFMVVLSGAILLFGGWQALDISMYGGIRSRSYFGVYTVSQLAGHRNLSNGSTLHGVQLIGSPERERWPTTYYVPRSGVGEAMRALPALYGRSARVGVVGLGAGTLACYALPGQHWRFFEIDPMVVRIARDSGKFSFLSDCLPKVPIEIGDARLKLSAEATNSFDLLVLDAFSSDAVPMHLMTREAFATYRRVLSRDGLLLVHISNRFLSLAPVVAAIAQKDHWSIARMIHLPQPGEDQAMVSDWIAMSPSAPELKKLTAGQAGWQPVALDPHQPAWTDDYASILPALLALKSDDHH